MNTIKHSYIAKNKKICYNNSIQKTQGGIFEMSKAPMYHDGKQLKFEETFRSAFARPTEESARQVLEDIRSEHSAVHGWVELDSRIEKTSEGYVAVRHHAQYR